MVDDVITDLEIAVLCDLVDGPRVNLKAHRRSVLDGLVAKGLIAPTKDEPKRFQLTDKAHHQSRPQESEQDDKWSFCLTAGTLCPANQER